MWSYNMHAVESDCAAITSCAPGWDHDESVDTAVYARLVFRALVLACTSKCVRFHIDEITLSLLFRPCLLAARACMLCYVATD